MSVRSTFVLVLGFVLLWNSGFIGAEFGLPHAPTFTLMFWRYWIATLVLALGLIVLGRLRWPGWRPVGYVMCIGVLSHGVWLSCVMLALERGVPAGIVALVVALQPLATGALSGLVTGERTPLHRWVGLALGFAGVCVVLLNRIDFEDAQSVFSNLIPMVSVVAITVATLLERRADLYHRDLLMPSDLELYYQGLATAAAVTLPAIWLEGLSTQWNGEFIGALVWLVLAVSLGAYALMWKLIDRMDATRVASLFYFGPPVTMVMAWLAFGDRLRASDLLGLGIVLVGVGVTYMRRRGTDGHSSKAAT